MLKDPFILSTTYGVSIIIASQSISVSREPQCHMREPSAPPRIPALAAGAARPAAPANELLCPCGDYACSGCAASGAALPLRFNRVKKVPKVMNIIPHHNRTTNGL